MEKTRGHGYKLLLGMFQLERKRKIFQENNQPLKPSPKGSVEFPNPGHFWDLAGQGTGSPCLGLAFAKEGWTR